MTLIQNQSPSTRRSRLALLAVSLTLAGCGATTPTGAVLSAQRPDTTPTTSRVASTTLSHVKAPPGFHVGKCEFLPASPTTQCYRRTLFVPLDTARFVSLITASGLTPRRGPLTSCRDLSGRRRPAAIVWDTCTARANLNSLEFAIDATSVKILHRNALKPEDLKVARTLRGTVYEVTLVTQGAVS
jgi:hypothetical protein